MADRPYDHDGDPKYNYVNTHRCRGKAIVFTHGTFKSELPPLLHSGADYDYLSKSLIEAGFVIERCQDYPRYAVLKKLEEIAKDDTHINADMFMCIFLTYGDPYQGFVYASDLAITLDEIQKLFTGDVCPNLLCKPKYFVFQAHEFCSPTETDDGEGDENQPLSRTTPADADFLLHWSTMKDDKYFWDGNRQMGTLFSRAMANELTEMVVRNDGADFKDIFYLTNAKVAEQMEMNYKLQLEEDDKLLPVIEDSLTKFYPFRVKNSHGEEFPRDSVMESPWSSPWSQPGGV